MEKQEIFKFLKKLAEIPGPVGREEKVQNYLESNWNQIGIKTRFDKIGNLYGEIEGEGPHWAIVGHADSIGFLVQKILPSGFLKMAFNTAATTPDARFLAGTPLEFLNDRDEVILGYFGLRSGHLAGIEGKKKPILFEDLFIDLGVDSSEEVRDLGIDVGTPAVFGTTVTQIGRNYVGKAMDNRIAGTIQTFLGKKLREIDNGSRITLISTVQEELGMKGAAAAAKTSEFDGVINVDVGLTGDFPNTSNDYISTKLGAGPIIVYKDFSIHYSHSLIKELEASATSHQIPFQKAVFKNYNTDGMYFFMQGFPTIALAVPCRYTHTNFETVQVTDIQNTLLLLSNFIS
ncbi:MAG: M42 family metallopeptidase [Candidatus Hodarchaeota archaeon]